MSISYNDIRELREYRRELRDIQQELSDLYESDQHEHVDVDDEAFIDEFDALESQLTDLNSHVESMLENADSIETSNGDEVVKPES